jgi:hypothetical protein
MVRVIQNSYKPLKLKLVPYLTASYSTSKRLKTANKPSEIAYVKIVKGKKK